MASSHPRISILVPCRDDGAFLDEALRSLAGQTCGDFEAVVSDDASHDESPRIAAAWQARDARFRLLRNERNLGMTENWNRALGAARGEHVAKLDADDLWRPGALAALLGAFERHDGLLAAFCRVEVLAREGGAGGAWPGEGALRAAGLAPEREQLRPGRAFWLASVAGTQLWHSNAFLVPRAELLRLGGFDERWSCASDTALELRLLAENRPVAHLPEVGVLYRRRAGSVSDEFERRGWKALEALLVRLDALTRDAPRFAPLPRAVRQAWWQAWRSLGALAGDAALWRAMPARLHDKLRRAAAAAAPPPRRVRLEGWTRLQLWRVRARLGGRAAAAESA